MKRRLLQAIAVTWMSLRSLPQRFAASLVVVVGTCGVVAVLLSVLAMAAGFRSTIEKSASPERVIVLSTGAESEAASSLARSAVAIITAAPGVTRSEGSPVLSADALLVASVARKDNGEDAYVTLRGVGPHSPKLRPEIKIVEGRYFRPAVRELIVGRLAESRFAGLTVGSRILLRGGEWTVVGRFESGGNSIESTLIADTETVLAAYQWNVLSSVTVHVASAEDYAAFKNALTSDPTLQVDVKRESEYVANISRPLHRLLNLIAYGIGTIMAIGALSGSLNTMYAAVSARGAEIATLRAIGFSSNAVIVSVLVEAMLLALCGAGIGAAIALAVFDGHAISTISGNSSPSQLVYQLTVTGGSIAIAIGLALALGILGALLPALRSARLPIATALRER